MPQINLNQIRTGVNSTDRLISAGQAIISNPAAGLSIAKNLVNSGALGNALGGALGGSFGGGRGPSDTMTSGQRTPSAVSGSTGFSGGKFKAPIMFPDDLDDQHYMTFRIMRSVRKKALERTVESTEKVIILPVPANLAVNYAADYENAELGMLGALGAGDMSWDQLKSGGAAAAGDMIAKGKDMIQNIGGNKELLAAGAMVAGATVAAKMVGGGGLMAGVVGAVGATKVMKGMGKRAGLVMNPHMAVLFKGIGFKDHSFNFKFIPRNESEYRQIKVICNLFKNHMLPSYAYNKLAFNYPDEFQIGFAPYIKDYLYIVENCVLKSCNITYNSSGVPSFSRSGTPMEVDLALTFQEVKLETRPQTDAEMASDKAADDRGKAANRAAEQAKADKALDEELSRI